LIPRSSDRAAQVCLALGILWGLGTCGQARAQAWLPPRGEGSVALAYQYYEGGDHLFSTDRIDGMSTLGYTAEGSHWYLGEPYGNSVIGLAEYGLSDRFALSGSLAWVATRYEGRSPADFDQDDGYWHSSITDLRISGRFAAMTEPLALTPVLAITVPVTDYPTSGHSALGDGLAELQLGVAAGYEPDWPLGSFVDGTLSYAITEKAGDENLGRLRAGASLGYFIAQRYPVRGIFEYLNTYNGVEWISDDPSAPCHHCGGGNPSFDEAGSAARHVRLGVGASAPLLSHLGLFGTYMTTVWGQNTDDTNFVTFGFSWGFSFRGPAVPPLGPAPSEGESP
jgi:hypothetical protein